MLSPGTPWDRLAVRPCDVPCVVKLGPPLRGMAQTQPPLVGLMLCLFPSAPLDLGLGPWEGVYPGNDSAAAAAAARPIWGGTNWMRAGFPKRGTPCVASPRSSGVGGAGGPLFSARSSQVVRLCLCCPSLTAPEKAASSRNAPSTSSPKQRGKRAGSPPRPPPGLWYLAVAPSAPAPPAFAYISSVPVLPYPSATV